MPLDVLCKRDNRNPSEQLPRVVDQIIWQLNDTGMFSLNVFLILEGVRTEGIFRISANFSHMKELKKLIQLSIFLAFISSECLGFPINWPAEDPHTLAGLTKTFIRDLPEPLLLFTLYNKWIDVASPLSHF